MFAQQQERLVMNIYKDYIEKGFSVLPIGLGTKYPAEYMGWGWSPMSWGSYKENLASIETTESWARWGGGIGCAMGAVSNIVALDFDHDVDGLHEKIKAIIPDSPVKKVGKKGFTAFYKYTGQTNKKFGVPNPENPKSQIYVVELLSSGNQTVLPPTIHPETKEPYMWTGASLLDDIELPALPDDFEAQVNKLIGKEPVVPREQREFNLDDNLTLEEAHDAINYIDPDCDYGMWVDVGMALKEEYGESAFSLWDSWSSRGSKYKGGLAKKWSTFNNTGVSIGSFFYHAKNSGWIRTFKKVEQPVIDIIKGGDLFPAEKPKKKVARGGFPMHLYDEAPGLVGDVAKWITSTAYYQQPILSLAAAIGCVGVVMGHKVQSPTRSRSNMLVISLAPSAAGKEHPQQAVSTLLNKANMGEFCGGEPESSAGLLTSLSNNDGVRLIQIDEIGRILKTLIGKNVAGHKADLITIIMKLYSKSTGIYYGKEYANSDGKRERKDIDQPCLCLNGATVPEHFFESMSNNDAIDGFLSRFLVLESKDFPIDGGSTAEVDYPPEGLITRMKKWGERSVNPNPDGDIDSINIRPLVVPYTPDAEVIAKDFQREMRLKTKDHNDRHTGFAPVWGRVYEQVTKLSLVGHEGDVISKEVLNWAIELAVYNANYLCDQIESRISDNEYEKDLKWVKRIIDTAGKAGIERSTLTNRTRKLEKRKRNDIIESLVEGGDVDVELSTTTGGRAKQIFRSVK